MNQKIHELHKELVHYTTSVGLHGIVTSKTFWASHTSFLNDSEEIIGFFDRVLPKLLHEPFERYFKEAGQEILSRQLEPPLGEDPFQYWLNKIVHAYRLAETTAQDHYVLSFCTTDDPWVSRNGLLSQWRAYGQNGGYAIVFDARGLDELLTIECKGYYEEGLLLGNVEYHMAEPSSLTDVGTQKRIRELQESSYEFFRTNGSDKATIAMQHIPTLATLCKHRGFEEEREVRIIVSEPSVAIGPDPEKTSNLPYRVVRHYIRGGVTVPCIHLFEDQKLKTLPISRVIVGPHPDKRERMKAVRLLLMSNGINAEVEFSETPYRGT